MKKILIIGAGQLGSRHLQALKNVQYNLDIRVIDPSSSSLKIAKERFDSLSQGNYRQEIKYYQNIAELEFNEIDIVINASNSNVRRNIIESLLRKVKVHYFILEKLLFQRKEDYFFVKKLFDENGSRAFVNCSMRAMPFYFDLKKRFSNKSIFYTVSGSQYYLVTNLIHYLDHIAFLSDCNLFEPDTRFLESKTIESSRPGYKEINGTFLANFSNGSKGIFTCYPVGNSPVVVQIYNENLHCISRESEGKIWLSGEYNDWNWEEIESPIPFQSQMTTTLVEQIFDNGTCPLVEYNESMNMHLILLDALLEHLNSKSTEKFEFYPFT